MASLIYKNFKAVAQAADYDLLHVRIMCETTGEFGSFVSQSMDHYYNVTLYYNLEFVKNTVYDVLDGKVRTCFQENQEAQALSDSLEQCYEYASAEAEEKLTKSEYWSFMLKCHELINAEITRFNTAYIFKEA